MKKKERETSLVITASMAELKKLIEQLPEDTILSITMEGTKNAEKE